MISVGALCIVLCVAECHYAVFFNFIFSYAECHYTVCCNFIYCYAEYHHVVCHSFMDCYAEHHQQSITVLFIVTLSTEYHNAVCCTFIYCYAEYHFAVWRQSECRYALCHYVVSLGSVIILSAIYCVVSECVILLSVMGPT